MIGHIKIDRKILNWEWFTDHKTFHLFIYLLISANYKDKRWRGVEIKRGQLITGRLKLALAVRLSEMEVRTCLNKLKMTNEITIKSTNQFSIITICKYDIYQSKEQQNNQPDSQQDTEQTTNKQPTDNQRITTTKEYIHTDKNDKNISEPESFPNWRKEVQSFLKDEKFKRDFIKTKKIGAEELEKRMNDFVVTLNNKMDYKNHAALISHFRNSYAFHVEKSKSHNNGSMSNGFIEVPQDFDYNGENVLKW